MVTMATELFCLNKLLKSLRYFHVVFLSVVLRVKIFNLTTRDTNSKYWSNFDNFLKQNFFLKNNLFPVFNVLFVGYSLAKNNLNSTYQYNMIPKKKILRQRIKEKFIKSVL
jgi:hypothetical protein